METFAPYITANGINNYFSSVEQGEYFVSENTTPSLFKVCTTGIRSSNIDYDYRLRAKSKDGKYHILFNTSDEYVEYPKLKRIGFSTEEITSVHPDAVQVVIEDYK